MGSERWMRRRYAVVTCVLFCLALAVTLSKLSEPRLGPVLGAYQLVNLKNIYIRKINL